MAARIVVGRRERWKRVCAPTFRGTRDYVLYGSYLNPYRLGSREALAYRAGYLHGLSFHVGDYPELRLVNGVPLPWFVKR